MSNELFRRTTHCCRTCLGPVLAHDAGHVCAVCDAAGRDVKDVCGCGIRVAGPGGRRLPFSCHPNPARSPVSPSLAVILFAPDAPPWR